MTKTGKNPNDKQAPPKYYPVSKSLKPLGKEALVRDMVKNTSLTYQEALTAIDYLFDSIPNYLAMGFTVQMGEIGHFRITFHTEGSTLIEEATPDKIKRKRLVFVCGKEIREAVNNFKVEKFPEA